jgi:very-short-patch-repair endonuclease
MNSTQAFDDSADHSRCIWKLEECEIHFVEDVDGRIWFCAKDLAEYFGYFKNGKPCAGNILRHIPKDEWKRKLFEIARKSDTVELNIDPELRFADRDGVQFMCRRMIRNPKIDFFAKQVGFDMVTIVRGYIPEVETIAIIQRAFRSVETIRQYQFGPYRIDLYIPMYKIAIECDENHHRRHQEEDLARQKWLEKNLGCEFIRYMPQMPDFDIIDVIAQISDRIHRYVLSLTT